MRVRTLKRKLATAGLEAYLVTSVTSVYYFSGFLDVKDASVALIIPLKSDPVLYVSELSFPAAKKTAKGCVVKLVGVGESIVNKVEKELSSLGVRTVGFDSLSAPALLKLHRKLENIKIKPNADLVWSLRRIKDSNEIACIMKAAEIADKGMEAAIETFRSGIFEYEIVAEAEYAMRVHGSESFAFDTIVASGPKSALPHGMWGNRRIRRGDFVIIDIGAVYRGYRSDLTRTLVAGKPSPKQRRVYDLVLHAQEEAFKAIQPGVKAKTIDSIARRIIEKGKYGNYFIHGLGHGIGLDIHEPPVLNPVTRDVLEEGNVVSNEPAVYIPNFGGVRVEDTVQVLAGGAKRLTRSPHELMWG